jgi:hypothetical protein
MKCRTHDMPCYGDKGKKETDTTVMLIKTGRELQASQAVHIHLYALHPYEDISSRRPLSSSSMSWILLENFLALPMTKSMSFSTSASTLPTTVSR